MVFLGMIMRCQYRAWVKKHRGIENKLRNTVRDGMVLLYNVHDVPNKENAHILIADVL